MGEPGTDRFAIDASVALAFGHRRGVDLRIEQALLRLLSPRPRVSVLPLADAETLHSRPGRRIHPRGLPPAPGPVRPGR
jgi:hypothetical protein